jgi:hypothetical protein
MPNIGDKRVVGRLIFEVAMPGYVDERKMNFLQEYRGRIGNWLPRWVDIDSEEVPSWAAFDAGLFGDTTWRSKFVHIENVTFCRKY